MKKTCFFLFIAIPLWLSCDGLEYSGETKYVFEGRVSDREGQPLKNILLSVHVSKDGSPGAIGLPGDSDDYDLISYVHSDSNGYYRMVFPKPTNQDNIALGINTNTEDARPDENLSSIYVTNIQNTDLEDYFVDFGERRLYNLSDTTMLTVTFTNASFGLEAVPLGLINNAIEVFNTTTHQLYPANYDDDSITYTFQVARNQSLILRYSNGGAFGSIEEIPITIGNEPVIQTINL